jgi:hypothetical protein
MASRLLVVAASVALLLGGLAAWTAREALSTDQWVDTSSALARDPAIREATANYLSQELPAVAGMDLAERDRLVRSVLRSPAFDAEWRAASRAAHRRFVRTVDGDREGPVVLNLRPMLVRLAARFGLGAQAAARLDADAGRVTIVRADELDRVRNAARLLRGGAWVLCVLAVVLLVASVVVARDRRRAAVLRAGIAVVVAGLGLLVVRAEAGDEVVDELTRNGAGRSAAEAGWRVGTASLVDLAWVLVAAGGLVALTAGALALVRGPRTARPPRTSPR